MLLIKAEPSEYVEDVKEKICSRKSIPVKRQILSLDGIVLDDAKTLHSLGIMDGSTLQLGLMEVQLRLHSFLVGSLYDYISSRLIWITK
jgi:Ubiquitin family